MRWSSNRWLPRYTRNTNERGLSSDGEPSSDDLSVLHVNNAVGLGRELVVMRDDHEGRAARLAQRAHQSKQPIPAVGIEVAGRFISQDNIWLLHEREPWRLVVVLLLIVLPACDATDVPIQPP